MVSGVCFPSSPFLLTVRTHLKQFFEFAQLRHAAGYGLDYQHRITGLDLQPQLPPLLVLLVSEIVFMQLFDGDHSN